jgi:hypothetical protein
MTTNKMLTGLLKLKGLRIVNCWFEPDGLVLAVKPYKNGRRCPPSAVAGGRPFSAWPSDAGGTSAFAGGRYGCSTPLARSGA